MVRDHRSDELSITDQDLGARSGECDNEEQDQSDVKSNIPAMVASMMIPMGATIVSAIKSVLLLFRKSGNPSIIENITGRDGEVALPAQDRCGSNAGAERQDNVRHRLAVAARCRQQIRSSPARQIPTLRGIK